MSVEYYYCGEGAGEIVFGTHVLIQEQDQGNLPTEHNHGMKRRYIPPVYDIAIYNSSTDAVHTYLDETYIPNTAFEIIEEYKKLGSKKKSLTQKILRLPPSSVSSGEVKVPDMVKTLLRNMFDVEDIPDTISEFPQEGLIFVPLSQVS